jgi:Flp pilus assembly protein TadD
MNRIAIALMAVASCALSVVLPTARQPILAMVHAAESAPAAVTVDYPRSGAIFPPEIIPPTFLWHDASPAAAHWRIDISFADGAKPLHFESNGEKLDLGEIDPRCVSPTNELPKLTPELEAAHAWKPDPLAWEEIKKHSIAPATVTISGFRADDPRHALSSGETVLTTSKDPVGAPIFYRDVPLMPSETEKGIIKPLAPDAVHLIQWRLRSIDQPQSRVVLEQMHTCANCHSFALNGKTMGMDMDGPQNDKGLYALVPIQPQMSIGTKNMVNWDPTQDRQFASNRVAFMSQVSPTGKYVLTMVGRADKPITSNAYVANFKDYRFLQVFYPTRGVLAWYDSATGERHPLPGADDPDYVQTNGVWSPDEKYVVFARARSKDPYPAGAKLAEYANDPNETQIQYDLYRVPFNEGRGGKAEPIVGASNNGMSNGFPKVSPDGRWIVFVQCKNGELMRPDSKLYIIPAEGGTARPLNANMSPMNSWHSWSPNGRWLVFSSKSRGPYTKMFLTHIDEQGNDSPAVLIDNATASNRAVNIPEFVNIPADGMVHIATPAVDMYKQFDHASDLASKGQFPEALIEWQALAAGYPDDARIHNNLGSVLERLGETQQAIPQYKKALELNPQYNLVHRNLASALMKTGQIDEAMREYQAAIAAVPDAAEIHNLYAMALARTGHLTEATDEFVKATELNPGFAEAENNLGIALAQQGRVDEATRHFARAVELNPRFAEAHKNLGRALAASGQQMTPEQSARAEQEFKQAIAIDSHDADAANDLGTLYRQQGNSAEAERVIRQAIESNPTFINAYLNLSDLLASQSRYAEADEVLQKALQIDPSNREAQSLRDRLKTRGGQ